MSNDNKKILIVGGGTAGLTIYSSLEDYFDVTILEKSGYKKMPYLYRVPLFVGFLFSKSNKYVNKFDIVSHGNRIIPFFNSKCLGGASVINGSVHVVGDLNTWESLLKIPSANFKEYFQGLYNSLFTKENEKHKINLKEQDIDELDEAFYSALKFYSVDKGNSEFFGEASCGPILNTAKRFTRSSVLDLLLAKLKSVKVNVFVDDIEIKDGCVRGVWAQGQFIAADVVILSGGVVGTNVLLKRVLSQRKLSSFHDNEISKIKDHTNLRINVRSKSEIFSLNSLSQSFLKKISFILENNKRLISTLRGSGASSAANVDLYGEGRVTLRLNLLRFYENGRLGSAGKLFDRSEAGFSISITQINPKSKGIVGEDGSVNPNYLSEPEDIRFLKDALKYAVKLLQTPPLSDYVEEIIDLEVILASPEKYIMKNFYSGYHLIGGATDLIDSNFQIKGVEGLYVCDASIFSEYTSSNIHSSVVLLARAFSKKILDNV